MPLPRGARVWARGQDAWVAKDVHWGGTAPGARGREGADQLVHLAVSEALRLGPVDVHGRVAQLGRVEGVEVEGAAHNGLGPELREVLEPGILKHAGSLVRGLGLGIRCQQG